MRIPYLHSVGVRRFAMLAVVAGATILTSAPGPTKPNKASNKSH